MSNITPRPQYTSDKLSLNTDILQKMTLDDYKEFINGYRLDDCIKLVRILVEYDIIINPMQAHYIWEEFSNSWCAGWLCYIDDVSDITNLNQTNEIIHYLVISNILKYEP